MRIDADLFLLDMDGTLYLSDQLIDGAVEAVNRMRKKGKVLFLTNNSSKSRLAYQQKLERLGFAPRSEEIFTSGMCASEYLSLNHADKSVYVVGTQALITEMQEWGVTLFTEKNGAPDIVLLGYDTELTYEKLARAVVYIRNGATYYTTHRDVNCPSIGGYVPDAGAFMELIRASTGKTPQLEFGKPCAPLAQAIARRFSLPNNRIAMVGDRLYTDVQFAQNNGFVSVLVLSGESTLADVQASGITPMYVLNSVKDIE